jgi:hypothetical protein
MDGFLGVNVRRRIYTHGVSGKGEEFRVFSKGVIPEHSPLIVEIWSLNMPLYVFELRTISSPPCVPPAPPSTT